MEIIYASQRNEKLAACLVLWLTNILNTCSWGFLFVLFISQEAVSSSGMGCQYKHTAFEWFLSMLCIIKCVLLVWVHPVLMSEHIGIFLYTMEVVFLGQNCLVISLYQEILRQPLSCQKSDVCDAVAFTAVSYFRICGDTWIFFWFEHKCFSKRVHKGPSEQDKTDEASLYFINR